MPSPSSGAACALTGLDGFGSRKRLPILGYIVDFACREHRLVIEIDGSRHHNDAAVHYDRQRTEALQQNGWTVIRFWSDDVARHIDDVCLHIPQIDTKEQS